MSIMRPGQAKGPSCSKGTGNSNFLDPVLSIFDNTSALPVDPNDGDRYIALVTANGWTLNHIYEWNGSSWVDTTPVAGNIVFNSDDNQYYSFNGTYWLMFPVVLYGTGDPPDPTGYPDGTIYVKYNE